MAYIDYVVRNGTRYEFISRPISNSLAGEYASTTYDVGDYVMHQGVLYRCVSAIAEAKAWDANDWVAVSLASELHSLRQGFDLTYLNVDIQNFTLTPALVEKGDSVSSVTCSYSLNRLPSVAEISVNNSDYSILTKAGTVTVSDQVFSDNATFILSCTDVGFDPVFKSATLRFVGKINYGSAPDSVINDTFLTTTLDGHTLMADRDITVNTYGRNNEHIWIAMPSSFAAPKFEVGGFFGGFTFVTSFNHTNLWGHQEQYQVWRSDNKGLKETEIHIM